MKLAQIVHNPTAGNASHKKVDLLRYVEKECLETNYVSTEKEGWKDFLRNNPDLIVVAGGDGTVNKLAKVLLKAPEAKRKIPIHLLPYGTANNIATTLKVPSNATAHKINPEQRKIKFNYGRIIGLKEQDFFLESVGVGIFPKLISEMKKNRIESETPSEKLQRTQEALLKIIRNFKAEEVEIIADGVSIKGVFLMVELMNIKYIGPNLKLARAADPGDGYLDLVLIPDENRGELQDYLLKMIKDGQKMIDISKFSKSIRAKKIMFKHYAAPAHVDDDLLLDNPTKSFKVEVEPDGLQFFKISSAKE